MARGAVRQYEGGMDDADNGVDLAAQAGQLAALISTPPEGADLAELTCLLGVTLLHLYDQEGDLATLSTGISHLHDARVCWLRSATSVQCSPPARRRRVGGRRNRSGPQR